MKLVTLKNILAVAGIFYAIVIVTFCAAGYFGERDFTKKCLLKNGQVAKINGELKCLTQDAFIKV